MAKKTLSIIIVPHTKTSTKTLSFSRRALKITAVGSAVFLVALIVFLVDYFSMGFLRARYKVLVKETAEQKVKIGNYEKSIGELQAKVTNFDDYVKKLNVMAGLKSPDVLKGPAGIGGGPSAVESSAPQGTANTEASQAMQQGSIQGLSQKAQSIENNFGSLINYFEGKGVELASTPSIMPVRGWVNSGYGMRADPFTGQQQMHWGIDIATETGNPIVATADGIVIKAQYDKYLGNNVTISHNNGYATVYGHMSKMAVRAGQKVKRYDVIGYVGQTGKAVGPHVHYEVHKDGKLVNPYNFILEE